VKKKALAGLGFFTLTAGGDFHPALRTSAARLSGLSQLCPSLPVPASANLKKLTIVAKRFALTNSCLT
jgi:hypothetical protein